MASILVPRGGLNPGVNSLTGLVSGVIFNSPVFGEVNTLPSRVMVFLGEGRRAMPSRCRWNRGDLRPRGDWSRFVGERRVGGVDLRGVVARAGEGGVTRTTASRAGDRGDLLRGLMVCEREMHIQYK